MTYEVGFLPDDCTSCGLTDWQCDETLDHTAQECCTDCRYSQGKSHHPELEEDEDD